MNHLDFFLSSAMIATGISIHIELLPINPILGMACVAFGAACLLGAVVNELEQRGFAVSPGYRKTKGKTLDKTPEM